MCRKIYFNDRLGHGTVITNPKIITAYMSNEYKQLPDMESNFSYPV